VSLVAAKFPPLLYTDTSNPDQLYFSRVEVHDPFIAFGAGKRRITVQSALEFGRIKKAGTFDEVLSLEVWRDRTQRRHANRVGPAEIIAELARSYRVPGFRIADDFPAALFVRLRDLGVHLEFASGPLFPEREIKSAAEARAIREGNRLCSVGFTVAEQILRRAKPRGRTLIFDRAPLTSDRLRFAIESAIMAEGGQANGTTIVAGGDQACDPHDRGSGPLRPGELIIIDIFPRVTKTGYFGDMTRTYLRGRATTAQQRLVETVRLAHDAAIEAVRANVESRAVHQRVVATFESAGYKTERRKNGSVGFIHGTGHGLGLAVHEMPRVTSSMSMPLRAGAVVTIEPGLYYPGLGGCRIEDVVQVTARGAKLLSSHPYDWVIR
jgi:Xaa-Pro aminopeptidase